MEMSDISYLSIQCLSVSQESLFLFKGEWNVLYWKSHVQEFTFSKVSGH